MKARSAKVFLNSWAGFTAHDVEVIGERGPRYVVRWLKDSLHRKAGRLYYPPKCAVRFMDEKLAKPDEAREVQP